MATMWKFVCLAGLLIACSSGGGGTRGPDAAPAPDARVVVADATVPDASAADAAAGDAAAAAAVDTQAPRVVRARLVSGPKHIIACGVIAFIGVYVYEVERVEEGPPLAGRIVVDVLCPDMVGSGKAKLAPGQVHRLRLGPAKREYARATPPASPAPELPRFEAKAVEAP